MPDAVLVAAASVCALVPVTFTIPVAVDVNAAFVVADVPVTSDGVNVPDADDVNAANVCALLPVAVLPEAAEVNAAFVVADVPVTVVDAGAISRTAPSPKYVDPNDDATVLCAELIRYADRTPS